MIIPHPIDPESDNSTKDDDINLNADHVNNNSTS